MTLEKSEGVVLRGADFSETSRVVTLLTPERGRLACLAKGARRRNSPLAPMLDTMNRVAVVYQWKAGRSVQLLTEAALLEGYAPIKADLERSAYASFPLELALKVAHENEPSSALYAVLVRGIGQLAAWTDDARTHACWQALHLLSAAGFAPVWEACPQCGGALGAAPWFRASAGLCCARCRGDTRLAPEEAAAFQAMMRNEAACPRMPAAPGVFRLVRRFATHQLETDFRSARVLEEMFG